MPTEDQFREALEDAKEKIALLSALVDQAMSGPQAVGMVVGHGRRKKFLESGDETEVDALWVIGGGNVVLVEGEHGKYKTGDYVLMNMKGMTVVDKVDKLPDQPAHIGEVTEVVNGQAVIGEMNRVVVMGKHADSIEVGTRVMLDGAGATILAVLPKPDSKFERSQGTGVSWDDIGGLEEAKQTMREAVEYPLLHADVYAHYGKKPVKGVLLYGPPGCGKTMLGKATASAIAGRDKPAGFFYVKAPEVLDRWVGSAETAIRDLFGSARKHKEETGTPGVVFIDEADAILGRRGSGRSSDMERTIVPAFLTEMDGLDEAGALVILATNRPDTLDPAVVRDGRIDRKVKVTRPGKDEAVKVLKLHLGGVPVAGTKAALAKFAAEELFSETYELKGGFRLKDRVSGAMLAGLVDQATSQALHRDVASGELGSVTRHDLKAAIKSMHRQNADLDISDLVGEAVAA